MIPKTNEGLASYLEAIGQYEQLTEDQARTASPLTLILSTLRLVVGIAKRYAHTTEELLDRIQDGNVGLIKASQTYDPAQGPWSHWAAYYIRGEIRNQRRDALGKPLRKRTDLPELTVIDDLPLEANDDPFEATHQAVALAAVSRVLTQKQRVIIQARLNGATYQELADQLGCSHQSVQCVEKSALKRVANL